MQQKSQPEYPFLYSLQGFQYCELLLSLGRYREVLERAGKDYRLVSKKKHGFVISPWTTSPWARPI